MSVTSITDKNKYLLWVKSGGRCQYRGCNCSLTQDILTKRNFNQSYIAHIVADVPGGPRGDAVRSPLLKDDITNLMLLCDTHHRLIDRADVAGNPEALLLAMKKEHEDRIESVTAIAPNMQSHILTYKANVGAFTPEMSYQTVSQFLIPTYYPAIADTIDLSLSNSVQRDRDTAFWTTEVANLEAQFDRKLLQNYAKGEIKHLSVFAFAPIPLLVKLGTLINDIYTCQINQKVRNPDTWNLDDDTAEVKYTLIEPEKKHKTVALNISLSATITNDRITQVLGEECDVFTFTIDNPFNDYLKSKKHLEDFSIAIRQLFNQIKAKYDAQTPIHIFPAMPIAKAVELGRVWMPKADMPLYLYDQNTANGGFTKAIEIVNS
ncbi:MAG TPA: HNH endonuclease [Flavobacterium sp.]|nr:HNH endonuclease [Flavobacterium sp.]